MKHSTHIIVAALTMLAFSVSLQARDDQPRIYINPGHGGWGPDDRPFATISHPATSTGRPDTCGFYESNTDLWKGIKMRETLIKMGLDEENIMMSRWNNGPYPYDGITYHSNAGNYNRNLTEICEEVDANDIDFFISIHSNGATEGATSNFPIFLYRGKNNTEYVPGSKAIGTALWGPHWMDEIDRISTSAYSRTKPYLAADIDFMGSSSSRTGSNGQVYTGYYGVLKHGSPGFIDEGFFHTYHPTRHRALNEDYCGQEGVRLARGCADYWNLTPERTGYIMGTVKNADNTLEHSLYAYAPASIDAHYPINGAMVKLYKGEVFVGSYVTDDNYNGIFYFENLEPGSDYYLDIKADGFANITREGPFSVVANETTYPALYMTAGTATDLAVSDATLDLGLDYQDWSITELEGTTVRRVLAHEGKLLILAVEGDTYHTPHIWLVNPMSKQVERGIDLTGIVNVQDDNNEGQHLYTVSDIAMTSDGCLLACNQVENQSSAAQLSSGDRGTFRVYKWNSLTGQPALWFTSPLNEFSSGHWYNADVGHSMAYNGSSTSGQLITSATTIGASRQIRFQNYVVRNGEMVRYFANYDYDNSSNRGSQSAAVYGEDFMLHASPRRVDQFVIDGSLIAPQEVRVNTTALKALKDMGSMTSNAAAAVGLSILVHKGRTLLFEPAIASDQSNGLWCYDVSGGIAHSEIVETGETLNITATPYSTAFTAADDSADCLSAYLLRDNRLSRWVGAQPIGEEVGIFAYDLNVAAQDDGYTFTFKCNNDATAATLILNDAATGDVVGTIELDGVVKGENAFYFSHDELPGEYDQTMTWAVNVHGRAITAIKRLNGTASDAAYAFHRASVAVDRSPESEHFGTIYVSDMATRNASRTSAANRDNGIYRFDATWQRDNSLPYTGNMAWDNNFRLAVDYRGRIYIPDFGDNHAGLYIANPDQLDGDFSLFFAGTRNSDGLFTLDGVNTGSSAPSVSIVGSGGDTKMYVSLEDMDAQVYLYDLGSMMDAQGNLPSTWTTAPQAVNSYTKMGALVNVNTLPMPDGGLWVSTGNNQNTTSQPALRYITPDHSDYWTYCPNRQPAENLDGCAGGGMALSNDGNTLVIANKQGELQFYAIDWGADRTKPALTWIQSFTPDARDVYNSTFNSGGHNSYGVYQMAFDWGGNLLVAGSNLGVYSIPTTDNQSTTPARSVLTVTKRLDTHEVTVTGTVCEVGNAHYISRHSAGEPIAEVSIYFDGDEGDSFMTTTLLDGTYTLDVLPGTYMVTASKPGYKTQQRQMHIDADNHVVDIEMERLVTGIDDLSQSALYIVGGQGRIIINSPEQVDITVVDLMGRVTKRHQAPQGRSIIDGITPGIYHVNGQKILVQ